MRQVQPMAEAFNGTPIAGSEAGRPVATIVIPAWNAWEHTKRCLESLRPTLGPTDQVVVVDNGSTDETRESLATYGWLEVVDERRKPGICPRMQPGGGRGPRRCAGVPEQRHRRPLGLARRAPGAVRNGRRRCGRPALGQRLGGAEGHGRSRSSGGSRCLHRIRRVMADEPPRTDVGGTPARRVLSRCAYLVVPGSPRLRRAIRDRRIRGRRPVPTVAPEQASAAHRARCVRPPPRSCLVRCQ